MASVKVFAYKQTDKPKLTCPQSIDVKEGIAQKKTSSSTEKNILTSLQLQDINPNNKILDSSNFTDFADDIFKVDESG